MLDFDEINRVFLRHAQDAPVNVQAIARDLGLDVHDDARMPPEIAGKLVRGTSPSPSGYAIYLNGSDPPRRKRFTLAHEIAHLILHSDLIGDGLIDDELYRSKLGREFEQQANNLAADMLMPFALVQGYYRGGTTCYAELGKFLMYPPRR